MRYSGCNLTLSLSSSSSITVHCWRCHAFIPRTLNCTRGHQCGRLELKALYLKSLEFLSSSLCVCLVKDSDILLCSFEACWVFDVAAYVLVLSCSLMLLCDIRCVNTPLFVEFIPLLWLFRLGSNCRAFFSVFRHSLDKDAYFSLHLARFNGQILE